MRLWLNFYVGVHTETLFDSLPTANSFKFVGIENVIAIPSASFVRNQGAHSCTDSSAALSAAQTAPKIWLISFAAREKRNN